MDCKGGLILYSEKNNEMWICNDSSVPVFYDESSNSYEINRFVASWKSQFFASISFVHGSITHVIRFPHLHREVPLLRTVQNPKPLYIRSY